MLCPKCNTHNRDNAKFCKVCGYSFTAEDIAASSSDPVHDADTQSASATQVAEASTSSINEVAPASTSSINEAPPQEAQAVEVVVQPEPVASAQPATLPEDDISLAPTQILSPQEMVAFQARRWQQEAGQSAGTDVSHSVESDALQPVGTASARPIANEETVSSPVAQQAPAVQTDASNVHTDVADMPTVMMSQNGDAVEGEPAQIPPPPPSEAQVAASGNEPSVSSYAEQVATPPASVTPPTQDDTVSQDVIPVGTDVSSPSGPSTEQLLMAQKDLIHRSLYMMPYKHRMRRSP